MKHSYSFLIYYVLYEYRHILKTCNLSRKLPHRKATVRLICKRKSSEPIFKVINENDWVSEPASVQVGLYLVIAICQDFWD